MIRTSVYKALALGIFLLAGIGLQGDESVKAENISHSHTWVLQTEILPTCEKDGFQVFSCDCGAYDTKKTDKLNHEFSMLAAQSATCTENGWEAYEGCLRCGIGEKTEIPSLGHDIISYDRQEPTCKEKGFEAYEACSRCAYTTYQELSTASHNFTEEILKKPTCLESGITLRICLVCEETYSDITIAKGHVWDEGVETAYNRTYTCQECSEIRIEEKLPNIDVNIPSHDVEKCQHDYTLSVLQSPTCTVDGIMELMCMKCGDLITQTIPAEHHYENGVCSACGTLKDQNNNNNDGNSGNGGNAGNSSTDNGNINPSGGQNTPNEDTPSTGEENKTEKQLPLGNVLYELNGRKTGYVCIGTEDIDCSEIIIADSYNGLPVVEIAKNAFMGMLRLNRVTIGKNIQTVGQFAFYDCPNLIEVYNKSTLKIDKIGHIRFNERVQLYTQEFESALKIDEQGFITYKKAENDAECYLVGYVGEEKTAVIPNGVTVICRRVFSGLMLDKVVIASSVTEIEGEAFKDALLQEAVFENKKGWKSDGMMFTERAMEDIVLMANYLTIECVEHVWICEK